MDNHLLNLAQNRRSIRKFSGEKVDKSIVDEILKIALLAPNSHGQRPVHFIVVYDKDMISRVAACKKIGAGPLKDAEVAIVVAVDRENRGELWIEDGAVASAYILLAAEEYGIGACWIHIRGRAGQVTTAEQEIQELLHMPEQYGIVNIVALGQKGEDKSPRFASDLSFDSVHQGKF